MGGSTGKIRVRGVKRESLLQPSARRVSADQPETGKDKTMAKPSQEVDIAPGVGLVIPIPDGPATAFIRMVNRTGEAIPGGMNEMLRVYDEGGCKTGEGCRFYNNQNYKFGVIQVKSPSGRTMFYTADYMPDWRWCTAPSCPVVPLWLYTIYYSV